MKIPPVGLKLFSFVPVHYWFISMLHTLSYMQRRGFMFLFKLTNYHNSIYLMPCDKIYVSSIASVMILAQTKGYDVILRHMCSNANSWLPIMLNSRL